MARTIKNYTIQMSILSLSVKKLMKTLYNLSFETIIKTALEEAPPIYLEKHGITAETLRRSLKALPNHLLLKHQIPTVAIGESFFIFGCEEPTTLQEAANHLPTVANPAGGIRILQPNDNMYRAKLKYRGKSNDKHRAGLLLEVHNFIKLGILIQEDLKLLDVQELKPD